MQIEPLNAAFDKGYAENPRIGLILLATDHVLEQEWQYLQSATESTTYHSRIWNDPHVSAETLGNMEEGLVDAARRLLPGEVLDAVAYGCTSATAVIGADAVAAQIHRALPDVPVTTPLIAAHAACKALDLKKIALITPYVEDVTNQMARCFEAEGIEIGVCGSFFVTDDHDVARLTPSAIADAARQLGGADEIEGIFLSCTNLRTLDILDDLEAELGKPVLSSNAVLAWHAMALAGQMIDVPRLGAVGGALPLAAE